MKTLKLFALIVMSALLTTSCEFFSGGDHPPVVGPIDEPKIIIDVQEAEDLYHRYGKEIAPILEKNNPGVQATRSLSIDYATLKQYLSFIEQEAKAANNTDITGLRIYFAKYEDSKNDGRATVFMNPLIKYGGAGINDDVAFAIDKRGASPKAVFVKDVITVPKDEDQTSNRTDFKMSIQGTVQSLAANNMPWRPPPPPPNDPDYQ